MNNEGKYVFVNIDGILDKGMSDSEMGKFIKMLRFLTKTNELKHGNGKPISDEYFMDFFGYTNKRCFKNLMYKFRKLDLVSKSKSGQYSVNPLYAKG